MKTLKRIKWIDFARSIAIICVLICHSFEMIYPLDYNNFSSLSFLSQIFGLFCLTIGRFGVPLFLFISGFLLLPRNFDDNYCKKYWMKNLLPLFISIEIWILLSYVFYIILNHQSFSGILLIKRLLFLDKMTYSQLWYLPMIIVIYLFIPFISKILNNFNYKILLFPILFVLIYKFIANYLGYLSIFQTNIDTSELNLGTISVYLLYLVFGYFVHENKIIIKKQILIIVFLISFLICMGFQMVMIKNHQLVFIWYDFLPLLICTQCLFLYFQNYMEIKKNKLIYSLSNVSFGIYLIHFPILLTIKYYYTIPIFNRPIKVIILSIIVLLLSYFIIMIINLIPYFGKTLFLIKDESRGKNE